MPSLGWYFNHTMQRKGTQIMEMLCNWNSFVALHAGEVQATCAISSIVDLRNLLCTGTTLVLKVVFNLKTKLTQASSFHSSQPKSQARTLTLSLHRCQPCRQLCPTMDQHCWLQPCQRQVHLHLGCSEARAGNQSWEREEETGFKQLGIEAALTSRTSSCLKIC